MFSKAPRKRMYFETQKLNCNMKKKLNVLCVVMLLLMAAQIIIGFVLNFNEGAQAFREGWEQGSNADASAPFDFLDGFLVPVLGFVCIFLLIRAFIAFVQFILNINRDKVFVKENIPLLRWAGSGTLIPAVVFTSHDLLSHVPTEKVYNSCMDDFIFGLFCLIVAEAFAIGLKLKEEQDLTI